MSQNNWDCHSNQIKLDYSTKKIIPVNPKGFVSPGMSIKVKR